jgi:hypothetical protein
MNTNRLAGRVLVSSAAVCALALTVSGVPASASASSAADIRAAGTTGDSSASKANKAGAVPSPVAVPLGQAQRALARTVARLDRDDFRLAVDSLRTLRQRTGKATHAAKNQIGKPPTDPESDTLPGPPSVLAVARLEHSVAITLVPRFDGMRRAGLVDALRLTLRAAHVRRDSLVDAVVALRPGARGDYADGMADTLSWYPQEIRQLNDALSTFTLPAESRTALENGRTRVQATKATMDAAFGGGE